MNQNGVNNKAISRHLVDLLRPEFDIRQIFYIIWRRKWWILIPVTVIVGCAIAFALHFVHPIYQSSAIIEIAQSRMFNQSLREVTPGVTQRGPEYTELEQKLLRTAYLTEVVDRLNLMQSETELIASAKSLAATRPWATLDEAMQHTFVKFLRENISISRLSNESLLFQISATHKSPETAFLIVKTLIDIFIEDTKAGELASIKTIKQASDEQLAIYEKIVKDSEARLRAFQQNLAARRAGNIGVSETDVNRMRAEIRAIESAIGDKQNRLRLLQAGVPPRLQRISWEHPSLALIKSGIAGVIKRTGEKTNPSAWEGGDDLQFTQDINAFRRESQRVLTALIRQEAPGTNEQALLAALEYHLIEHVDIRTLQAKKKISEGLVDHMIKMSIAGPEDQVRLEQLEDEVAQNRRIFQIFVDQSRGSSIEAALQSSDAEFKYSVVEPASVPIHPISGSKRRVVLIAFAASLALSVATVYALESIDQTIRDVEDVEDSLELPVWGVIPKMGTDFTHWYNSLAAAKQNGRSFSQSDPPLRSVDDKTN